LCHRDRLTLRGAGGGVFFASGGTSLVTVDAEGRATLRDAASGAPRGKFGRPVNPVTGGAGGTRAVLGSAPDGLARGSAGGDEAVLWDLATGDARISLKGHAARISALAFSGDGRGLATADERGAVKLWEVATGRERATLTGNNKEAVHGVSLA